MDLTTTRAEKLARMQDIFRDVLDQPDLRP